VNALFSLYLTKIPNQNSYIPLYNTRPKKCAIVIITLRRKEFFFIQENNVFIRSLGVEYFVFLHLSFP